MAQAIEYILVSSGPGGGGGSFTATTAQVGGAGANGPIRVWEFA